MKDEKEQAREANANFYKAFENLDIDAMEAIWSKANYVKCIHPGWNLLIGWDAIRRSWVDIFSNTDYMEFTLTHLNIQLFDQIAWVVLTENIWGSAGGEIIESSILATNIFEKQGALWLMIHHHGSPILTSPSTLSSSTTIH